MISAPPFALTYHTTKNVARNLNKAVRRSLLVESMCQTEKAAKEIEVCLEPATGSPELRGAYTVLKRWYRHTFARARNPSQADMVNVTRDYAAL